MAIPTLIKTQAHLVIHDPFMDGVQVELPHSYDWRFARFEYDDIERNVTKKGKQVKGGRIWKTKKHEGLLWSCQGDMEWIESLNALAPRGYAYPGEESYHDYWVPGGNQRWREVKVSGNPTVSWLEYYDAGIYTGTESVSTYSGLVTRNASFPVGVNWCLHLIRNAPPAGQTLQSAVFVTFQAEVWDTDDAAWDTINMVLFLPMAGQQYNGVPSLYVIDPLPETAYSLTDYQPVAFMNPKTDKQEFPHREWWSVEYIRHPAEAIDNTTGWFLIRTSGSDEPMLWRSPIIRPKAGTVSIRAQGSVVDTNLRQIRYGYIPAEGQADPSWSFWPSYYPRFPQVVGSTFSHSATFQAIKSQPTGWTSAVAALSADAPHVPKVTVTRTGATNWNERDVFWALGTEMASVFGEANATTDTTQGKHLANVSVTLRSDWRGATGTARMAPTTSTAAGAWKDNSPVDVYLGWQTGAGAIAEKLLTRLKIVPGSMKNTRTGGEAGGRLVTTFGLSDMVMDLVEGEIVFGRQAGGRNLAEWFRSCMGAIGIPAAQVYVDATLESYIIPAAPIPSGECFPQRDGDSWKAHLDSVCNACGVRWGFTRTIGGTIYAAFLDLGKVAYTGASTIAFTIQDGVQDEGMTLRLSHSTNHLHGPNAYRIASGDSSNRSLARFEKANDLQNVGLYVETHASRKERGALMRWKNVEYKPSVNPGDILKVFERRMNDTVSMIEWDTILRPDLLPEMFVQVSTTKYPRIATGTVFQIDEATYNTETARCTFKGGIVYAPGGAVVLPGSLSPGSTSTGS